jgi:hypothetical protein
MKDFSGVLVACPGITSTPGKHSYWGGVTLDRYPAVNLKDKIGEQT